MTQTQSEDGREEAGREEESKEGKEEESKEGEEEESEEGEEEETQGGGCLPVRWGQVKRLEILK